MSVAIADPERAWRTAAVRGSGWRSAVVLIVIVVVLTTVPDVIQVIVR